MKPKNALPRVPVTVSLTAEQARQIDQVAHWLRCDRETLIVGLAFGGLDIACNGEDSLGEYLHPWLNAFTVRNRIADLHETAHLLNDSSWGVEAGSTGLSFQQ